MVINVQQETSIMTYILRNELKDKLLNQNKDKIDKKYITCQMLKSFIFFRDINMLLNDDTKKLKANAQTRIFDIVPENIHLSPNNILNRSSAQNCINITSSNTTRQIKTSIEIKSLRILNLNLSFSAIRCKRTFEIDEAINAGGTDKRSLERSK